MFNDVDMKEIGKISLNYDVNNTTIPNTTLLVGTVKSELYIYDAG